jgi:NedA-like, galactose-binding domain/Glycosyl hydrolase family 65, C-terminal domain
MANILNNYNQSVVTDSDYFKLLRLYTKQHFLPDGKINLVENYDPNLGGPIVYYYWSNHYNHSSYNNLVISGLCGIRPSAGDTLEINPLIDSTVDYFYLGDVMYHGHKLSLIYDKDGSRYKAGKGLSVFVDNKKSELLQQQDRYKVYIGPPIKRTSTRQPRNVALNVMRKGYPLPTASINGSPDTSLYQAIDGKIWYFPEITNRWTTQGSTSKEDWFAVDLGKPYEISSVNVFLFTDGNNYTVPDDLTIEYENEGQWIPVKIQTPKPIKLTGNTKNTIQFEKVRASKMRITFLHGSRQVAVSEIEYL